MDEIYRPDWSGTTGETYGPWAPRQQAATPIYGQSQASNYSLAGSAQVEPEDFSFGSFAKSNNYDTQPYVAQIALWNKYRNEVLPKASESSRVPLSDLHGEFDKSVPKPKKPERSAGEMILDPLIGAASGVVGFGKMATDFIDPSSAASKSLGGVTDALRSGYSSVEKDAEKQRAIDQQRIEADTSLTGFGRFAEEAKSAAKNLSVGQVAELVGNILPSLALTFGVGAGAKALQFGAKGVQAATTGAGALTGAVGSGGDAAGSAYEAVMNLPPEKLAGLPKYADLVAQLGEDEARKTLALGAARTAQVPGTAIGAVLGPLGAEAALGKKLAGKEAGGRLATGAKEAFLSELPEEVGTTMAGNYGTQQVDPTQRLMQGAGQAAVLSAIGGFGGGALSGGGKAPAKTDLADELLNGSAPQVPDAGVDGSPLQIGYNDPTKIGMNASQLGGGSGSLSDVGMAGFDPAQAIVEAASMGGQIGGRIAENNIRFLDSAWRTGGEEKVRELAQMGNTVGVAARRFLKALEDSRTPKQLGGPEQLLALPSPDSDSGVLMAGAGGIRPASNREMQDRRARDAEIWRQQQETGLTPDVIQAQAARDASQNTQADQAKTTDEAGVLGDGGEPSVSAGQLGNVGADGQALKHVVLQNRDREGAASIAQMQQIASAPDYGRVSVSRQLSEGAPVVIDEVQLPDAQRGREEIATDAQGRKVRTRYAVVEAGDLLASHTADGQAVKGYERGESGKLRAVAGNGRVAGMQRAYTNGTALQYRTDLQNDMAGHGVDPQVIAGMKSPILVRTMSSVDVTADIGDRTNTSGVSQLSPVEQAKNDARRVDVAGLEFDDNGDPTPDSVRRFVQGMPESERGGLMDAGGQYGRQAVDRLMAAVFWKAYGDADLVQLYAQATDPEAKAVLNALADAAGVMAQLENSPVDIRDLVSEAAKAAVNAKRQGVKLSDFARTKDMTISADTQAIVDFFAENIRSAKRMGEGLRNAAQFALDNQGGTDMFGDVAPASRVDVVNKLRGQDDARTTQSDADAGRGEPAQVDAGRNSQPDSQGQRSTGGGAQADTGQGQSPNPEAVTATTNQPASAGFSLEKSNGTQAEKAQQTEAGRQEEANPNAPSIDEETAAAGDKWENKTLSESMTPREMGLLGVGRTFSSEELAQKFIDEKELAKDHKVVQLAKFKFGIQRKAQGPAMVALQKQKAKRDEEAGLTSPTREQIEAIEDAKAAAAKAEKAAKAADDARAKLEQERKEIAQRSAAAAGTFELGQDPMASLTGQEDIFSAPTPNQEFANPLANGEWVSLSGKKHQWRWDGMSFGGVNPLDNGTIYRWETTDGRRFEGLREAKAHEVNTEVTRRLVNDGFISGQSQVKTDSKPDASASAASASPEIDQDLQAMFENLDAKGLKKSNAQKQLAKLGGDAQYVQDHWLDILQDLDDRGVLKINCK